MTSSVMTYFKRLFLALKLKIGSHLGVRKCHIAVLGVGFFLNMKESQGAIFEIQHLHYLSFFI